MSKKLKPKEGEQGKRLATHSSADPDKLPPKFCLRVMRPKYSLAHCTKEEKSAFADRLFQMSQNSWAALRQMPRRGQGWEKIERTAITGDSVPDGITEDVHLIAFRFFGKAPMVGYRSSDGVFNILWLDRTFSL